MISARHSMVWDLLMFLLEGGKDSFGRASVPPLPLSFDRANDNNAIRSSLPIFSLPIELLHFVTPYFSSSDLASLALVDRDCRQLVRSIQFASIQLNYSDTSFGILSQLEREASDRFSHAGRASYPTLGSCIRRITLATHPSWVEHRHRITLQTLEELPREEQTTRFDEAASTYEGYMEKFTIALRHALPNLELLDWEDRTTVTPQVISAIRASPIRHLKLFRIQLDQEFEVNLDPPKWELDTLDLEVVWSIRSNLDLGDGNRKRGNTSPFIISIIREAAPTLRELRWNGLIEREQTYAFGGSIRRFPRLRSLTISGISMTDDTLLSACIPPGNEASLQYLSVDKNVVISNFLASRGCVPSLEAFNWKVYKIDAKADLSFIQANTQLHSLTILHEVPPALLDDRLVPVLASNFNALTALALTWSATHIAETSLREIGSITTLKKLWLSAGDQFGWRHTWAIDHATLLDAMKPLQGLSHLAFSRDSYLGNDECYLNGDLVFPVAGYYETPVLPQDKTIDDYINEDELDQFAPGYEGTRMKMRLAWERWHRERIVKYAKRYAKELPMLEWCYFGQLPMEITRKTRTGRNGKTKTKRKVIVQSDDRDSCWTLLRRMWGVEP